MSVTKNNAPILLFDGYCNLCNNCVKFVLRHEKNTTIQFSSLQSEVGLALLQKHNINPNETDSLVLIVGTNVYIKSTAALRLTTYFKGLYPLLLALLLVPTFIRNAVYDYVARNRYKWFGKQDSCMIPSPEIKNRFLE